MPGPTTRGGRPKSLLQTRSQIGSSGGTTLEMIASVTSRRGAAARLEERAHEHAELVGGLLAARRDAPVLRELRPSAVASRRRGRRGTLVLPTSTASSTVSLTARLLRAERHVAGQHAHHGAVRAAQPQRAVGVRRRARRPRGASPPGSETAHAAPRHAETGVEAGPQRREAARWRGDRARASRVPKRRRAKAARGRRRGRGSCRRLVAGARNSSGKLARSTFRFTPIPSTRWPTRRRLGDELHQDARGLAPAERARRSAT